MRNTEYRTALVVSVLLGTFIWLYYAALIGVGDLRQFDEFFTLDRSIGFARHNDWLTVYSGGEPTFRKPPLQYWMSALLMNFGMDPLQAVRAPSLFFALATLAATGLLAYSLAPNFPWVVPGAVLILCGSTARWQNSLTALLDTGATFFVTASLAAMVLALTRPRWWICAGILIGLGSLQKAPVPLLLLGLFTAMLYLSRRWTGFDYQSLHNNSYARWGTLIAIVLSFSWLLLQVILHGVDVLGSNYSEMIKRFVPVPLILFAVLLLILDGVRRWTKFDIQKIQYLNWFNWWQILALSVIIVWLGLLAIRNWEQSLHVAFGKTAAEQVLFTIGNSGRDLSQLSKLIIDNEWAIRGLGIAALLILPFSSKRKELWPLAGMVVIYILAMAFASGKIYGRYSLIFEPLQAAAIAAVLVQIFPKVWMHIPAILVVSVLSFGPLKPQSDLKLFPSKKAEISKRVFQNVGAVIEDEELLVVCQFSRNNFLIPGTAAVYGSPGKKFVFESSVGRMASALSQSSHRGNLRGVCRKGELEKIQEYLVGLERLEVTNGYVHWRAMGWAPNLQD